MRRLFAIFGALVTFLLAVVSMMTQQSADQAKKNLLTWIPDWFLENIWLLTGVAFAITLVIWLWPYIVQSSITHKVVGLREDGTWSWRLRWPMERLASNSTPVISGHISNSDKQGSPVSFYLTGKWLNTPFQCANVGKDEQGRTVWGEDLYVKIKANQSLKNVRLRIHVEFPPNGHEEKEIIYSGIFQGDVPTGLEDDFLIFRTKFIIEEKLDDIFRRVDLGSVFLDSSRKEIPAPSCIYPVKLSIFHDGEPIKASFSIDNDRIEAPHCRAVAGNGLMKYDIRNHFARPPLPRTQPYETSSQHEPETSD